METVFGLVITFVMLMFSIYKGIFIGYPLLISFFIFVILSLHKGYSIKAISKMAYDGGKKSFVVLKIFILIGAITAVWMSSGTVPSIVYYGINLMNPNYFIFYAFIISSLVSFLLGTSLGTVSTVGLALIVMAKSGEVNTNIAAGAIIAGAYFGDRCSPMSSSANLIANLTETELFINIKNMLKSAVLPFILSLILYFVVSLSSPLNTASGGIDKAIVKSFEISILALLPSIIILVLSIFRVNVKISMFLSIALASVLSIYIQDYKINEVLYFILMGFHLDFDNPLYLIIKGGGIISMLRPAIVVFISCSLAGIFEGTKTLQSVEKLLLKANSRSSLFLYTTIVSILTAAFGSNQSIAAVLTASLMDKAYKQNSVDKYQMALDLENTGIVLSALIPWNLAAFVPTSTMDVSPVGFIPYAFYLYLLPITSYAILRYRKNSTN
ncbi:Na+/H+ antiporter NhaC family protein [Acetoanaerobium noterae]|uniref:Na+/H+ antiporter NhaC family protein n=1 Tax=Acetoanaerobium noterae TaxID=745369 RepID=UPI003342298C